MRTRGRLYKEKSNGPWRTQVQGPLKKGSVSTVSKIQTMRVTEFGRKED